jgi:hypothetical protein
LPSAGVANLQLRSVLVRSVLVRGVLVRGAVNKTPPPRRGGGCGVG